MYSTIYELTFPDGSRYVGKTGDFKSRIAQHNNSAVNNLVKGKKEEFGDSTFIVKIIEENIHEAVAYFIERIEIKKTPEDKCLNIHCLKNVYEHLSIDEHKARFLENRRKNSYKIREAINVLKKELPNFGCLYNDSHVDNSKEVKRKIKDIEEIFKTRIS